MLLSEGLLLKKRICSLALYLFSPACLINSIIHKHLCKILYVFIAIVLNLLSKCMPNSIWFYINCLYITFDLQKSLIFISVVLSSTTRAIFPRSTSSLLCCRDGICHRLSSLFKHNIPWSQTRKYFAWLKGMIPSNYCLLLIRAFHHPILGAKFGPIPSAKKYVFFPFPDKKFPIWQKEFIFYFFLVLHLYFI